MPAASARETLDAKALIDAMGADECVYHQPEAFRLRKNDKTVSYGQVTKANVRLRVLATDLPATLLRGLDAKVTKKGTSIKVSTAAHAAKVKPILERIAATKAAS